MNLQSARAPERQSARAPERQSARAPERQSARAPERQSARAPERQSARAPERQSARAPERQSARAPERQSARAPERQSARAPERQSARAPERQSARAPERQSARAPERQSARAPERQSARAPERQSARAPERQSARAPASARAPERQSARAPERQSARAPERQSARAPERQSARAPERQSARAPERQSARAPERQSARAPERQSARAPERQSARAPERQSARAPERQSARAPERQSARAPERQSAGALCCALAGDGHRPPQTQCSFPTLIRAVPGTFAFALMLAAAVAAADQPVGSIDQSRGLTTSLNLVEVARVHHRIELGRLTLKSVKVMLTSLPTGVTVKTATGIPSAAKVATILTNTNPSSLARGNLAFTAPANTTRWASTTYYGLAEGSSGTPWQMDSSAEDTGGKPNWSMANGNLTGFASATSWRKNPRVPASLIHINSALADKAAPSFSSATVNGPTLRIMFDEDLTEHRRLLAGSTSRCH